MQQNVKSKWLHRVFVFLVAFAVLASYTVPQSFGMFGAQEAKAANISNQVTVTDWKYTNSNGSVEFSDSTRAIYEGTYKHHITFDIVPDGVFKEGDYVNIAPPAYESVPASLSFNTTDWQDYTVDGVTVGEFRGAGGLEFRIKKGGEGLRYLRGIKLSLASYACYRKPVQTVQNMTLGGISKSFTFAAANPETGGQGSDIFYGGAGGGQVQWRATFNTEEMNKLAQAAPNPRGQNYTKRSLYAEQEIPGGVIKAVHFQGAFLSCMSTDSNSIAYYKGQWTSQGWVAGAPSIINSKFTRLTPDSGETLEQFRARIKSAPRQYGVYDYSPLAGQVTHYVMANFGVAGDNGIKIKDVIGDNHIEKMAAADTGYQGWLLPEHVPMAQNWHEEVNGEGNIINGEFGAYDLSTVVEYSPMVATQVTGKVRYERSGLDDVERTAVTTVTPPPTIDPDDSPEIPQKLTAGWMIIDKDAGQLLNGATVKVQTKSGDTWADTPGVTEQKTRTIDGMDGRVVFEGLPEGTHRMVVTEVDGGKHDIPAAGVMSEEFTLADSDTQGKNLATGYVNQKKYAVTYKYVKGSGSTPALPTAISSPDTAGNYQVKDDAKYIEGWTVERKNPTSSKYTDTANNGEWNLSWDKDSAVMTTSGITFTGTWKFTADPATAAEIAAAKAKVTNVSNDLQFTKTSANGQDVWPADKWATSAAKNAMQSVINTVNPVINKAGVTKNELSAAVAQLDSAINTWNNAKKNGTKSGPNASEQKIIDDAKAALASAQVSTDGMDVWTAEDWVTQSVKNALQTAITNTEKIIADKTKTGQEKDLALNNLVNATNTFTSAKKRGLKTGPSAEEQQRISDAKKNADSVTVSANGRDVWPGDKWVTSNEKKALTDAIANVENVLKKPGVTGAEVTSAFNALAAAEETFNKAKKAGLKSGPTTEEQAKIDRAKSNAESVKVSVNGEDVWPGDKWVTSNEKKALTDAIKKVEDTVKKAGVTGAEVTSAFNALAAAEQTFNEAKKAGTKEGSTAEEQKLIDDAKANLNNTPVSTDGNDVWPGDKWITPDEKETFENAIGDVEDTFKKPGVTEAEVKAALDGLDDAQKVFNDAKKAGLRSELTAEEQKLIDDAKTNMNGTKVSVDGTDVEPADKWVTEGERKALEDAIKNVEDTVKKADVTGSEVKQAFDNLDKAVKAFDAAKKPGDQAAADARALAKAKNDAKAELDKVNVNLYEEPELSVVKKAIEDGKKEIDASTTIPQVDAAKKKALDIIAAQKTAAQKADEKKKTEDPKNIPTEVTDKTPANLVAVTTAITTAKNDGDLKGSTYAPLKFQSKKQTKKSIKLQWSKVKGAKQYTVYANQCGTKNKYKKLATVKGKTLNVKKVAGKKLKKGTNYKFLIIAENGDKVSAISKTLHIRTAGHKKYANYKSVSVKKTVIKKAKKLKKGKTLKLNAKGVVPKGKKVSVHVKTRYESANKKVATVTKAGKVKGIKKGKAKIYCYVQNGLAKVVTVTVK